MKVTVRDSEILKTIQPDQLAAYLLAHSWYEDRPFLENASIWLYKGDEAGEFEILLPIRRELSLFCHFPNQPLRGKDFSHRYRRTNSIRKKS